MSCSVTDEYTRKGLDVVFLENDTLRVEVLAGKGADIDRGTHETLAPVETETATVTVETYEV